MPSPPRPPQSYLTRLTSAVATRFARLDTWANTLTGVGNALGKNVSFTVAAQDFLPLNTLEDLYNLDGLAARVVDAVPKHALRHSFTLASGDTGVDSAVQAHLDAMGTAERFTRAWTWGRLFGGGGVYIHAEDGRDPREPIDESNLRRVPWITDVDRRDLYPMRWCTDTRAAHFGTPETYHLVRMGGTATQTMEVHASRIIRFEGTSVTRRRRLMLQGWGDSVLQRIYAELQQARGGFAAAGVLLQEASQGVIKMQGLHDAMATDDESDTFKRRLMLMDQSRSVARALMLDADGESYERVEVGALTGVVDVMDRMVNLLSAVSGIPVTILMGQAPAGLNATGDADIRNWYDEVAAERERTLRPRLERLVRLVCVSREGPTEGVVPASRKVAFPPLYQMTPLEQATLRQAVATTDAMYIDKGVVTAEEVAVSRFRDDGWNAETNIDLAAREAAQEADAAASSASNTGTSDAPGADHADGIAAILARVAAREIPRDAGVALLVASFGMSAESAEAVMGETGRTFFTAPEPGHAAEMDAMRAEAKALRASNEGHRQYTARVIQRAKEGGLELGAFTAQAPTETQEGDALKAGDVVAVPAQPATDGTGAPASATDNTANSGKVPQ